MTSAPRERKVLALMVQGRSILGKLGVQRRTEAVALAVQHHLATRD